MKLGLNHKLLKYLLCFFAAFMSVFLVSSSLKSASGMVTPDPAAPLQVGGAGVLETHSFMTTHQEPNFYQ